MNDTTTSLVAFDIETTGLGADAQLTVAGFRHPDGQTDVFYVPPIQHSENDILEDIPQISDKREHSLREHTSTHNVDLPNVDLTTRLCMLYDELDDAQAFVDDLVENVDHIGVGLADEIGRRVARYATHPDITLPRVTDDIDLHTCWTEAALIDGVSQYLADFSSLNPNMDDEDMILLTHNGETHRDGAFDIPHIRTRCAQNRVEWPFHEQKIMDTTEIVRLFNTKHPSVDGLNKRPLIAVASHLNKEFDANVQIERENSNRKRNKDTIRADLTDALHKHDINVESVIDYITNHDNHDVDRSDMLDAAHGLEEVHDLLIDKEVRDSVEDSSEVVEAYEDNNDVATVIRHNIADLLRMDDLRVLAEQYGWNNTQGIDSNVRIRNL